MWRRTLIQQVCLTCHPHVATGKRPFFLQHIASDSQHNIVSIHPSLLFHQNDRGRPGTARLLYYTSFFNISSRSRLTSSLSAVESAVDAEGSGVNFQCLYAVLKYSSVPMLLWLQRENVREVQLNQIQPFFFSHANVFSSLHDHIPCQGLVLQ